MASTQIEIALADDDRKRIDRLCQLMENSNEMQRKHANQASFIEGFHKCLDGIEDIRCIPGASIDGCWDAKAIRAVVEALLANCPRTWRDDWRGKEKEQCEHIIIEDDCGSAVCGKCNKDFGWYCQISTKHFCEYEGDEECIHCGAPEERQ